VLRLLTPLVHPLMGCNWLFFLDMFQLSYTSLSDWSQSEMSPLESGSSINSIISSLSSLCHFVFKGLSSAVFVKTNINRHLGN
jgi:hypothetical protein